MKGLLLKEWYYFSKGNGWILTLLCFCIILFTAIWQHIIFLILPSFILSVSLAASIGADKISNWERYSNIIPYSKNQLVNSKYITVLILLFVSLVFSAFVQLLPLIEKSITFNDWISNLIVMVFLTTLFSSSILPTVFKSINSFYIFLSVLFSVLTVIFLFSIGCDIGVIELNMLACRFNLSLMIKLILIISSALIFIFSWKISIHFYKELDF